MPSTAKPPRNAPSAMDRLNAETYSEVAASVASGAESSIQVWKVTGTAP
ncbi:hypothetical protein SBADM41S_05019 [Streptomyces badius]